MWYALLNLTLYDNSSADDGAGRGKGGERKTTDRAMCRCMR